MSAALISRISGAVVAAGLGLGIMWEQSQGRWPWPIIGGVALACALVALIITPYVTIYPYRWVRDTIRRASAGDIVAATIGLIVGLIIAALLTFPFSELTFLNLGKVLPFLGALLFGYLGAATAVLRGQDVAHLFSGLWTVRQRRAQEREERDREGRDRENRESGSLEEVMDGRDRHRENESKGKKNGKVSDKILLDTSAIIDGRIADISQTGFVNGTLLVPRFVLEELQHIADSADTLRRNRGRRGLDILNRLQKETNIPVEISDTDIDGIAEVDAKLVKMARNLKCPIITNDFNLNRVAELQGVKVLNINELANAVKPVLLPGEEMMVKIIQDGKELGQGVGYLDDGTMIVVEGGRQHMNNTVEVTVTRVLQTVAGRMIFAHPKGSAAKK
ncbi:MAG TPA: PIN domain-containing protein [Ktedonobacterales bacterium]|nr:PIN domain-containing protein [Ktedonobacterales bacterium]